MLLLLAEDLLADDWILFTREGVEFADGRTGCAGMARVGESVAAGSSSPPGEGFITRNRPVTLLSRSSNNHAGRSEGACALAMWYSFSARVSLDSCPGGVPTYN